MSTGRGDFESPFDGFLAQDLGKIQFVGWDFLKDGLHINPGRDNLDLSLKKGHRFTKIAHADDLKPGNDGCLGRVFTRHHHAGQSATAGFQRDRENAFDRADASGQGQLAHKHKLVQLIGGHLLPRGDNSHGDRQIDAGPLLTDVGRGQIDGGASHRHAETGVDNRGSHPVP